MNKYSSLISRVLFVLAFVIAGLAVFERLANSVGYTTIVRDLYAPGRLLEFSGVALLFVIALVLRDIKYLLLSNRAS